MLGSLRAPPRQRPQRIVIDYPYTIAGEQVTVHFLEHEDDLEPLRAFMRREGGRPLALDTETTGLDVYSPTFQIRLVQIGNGQEAFVLRVDRFRRALQAILNHPPYHWILHNVPYDALVLYQTWLVADLRAFVTRCEDTRLLAHILDPRSAHEGGTGHSLKPLSAAHVDSAAPDTQAGLHKVFKTLRRPYLPGEDISIPKSWQALDRVRFDTRVAERRDLGKIVAVSEGWRWIPIDHPTYVLYAGLDVILTHRLHGKLATAVWLRLNWDLYQWEKQVQRATIMLQARGMLVDVPYTEKLNADYLDRYLELQSNAQSLGLDTIGSNAKLGALLQERGVKLTARTPSGDYSVDAKVLQPIADAGDELAQTVLAAKHLEKRRKSYIEATLNLRDQKNRIHPWIRSLQARTARMSVAEPPYQQLPSRKGEWEIRRCVIADDGQQIISADLDAVELRVLAALADVSRMKEAVAAGKDLHGFTASLLFGDRYSDQDRQVAKTVGLGKVYGGGIDKLAAQSGLPREAIAKAVETYSQVFPEIRRYGWNLEDEARHGGMYISTWKGRRLPVEENFLYRAVNYSIQSTSRDILAQGLLECERRGLDRYLLLPIHDEFLAQAPTEDAEEVVHEIAEAMTMEIKGVPITASPSVYGRSWGSGYGCPAEKDAA